MCITKGIKRLWIQYKTEEMNVKITYTVKGQERKNLVAAISQELKLPAKYLGMPIMQRNTICVEYR